MNDSSNTVHNDTFVADLHCDTVLYLKGGRDFHVRNEQGHVDLPRLKEGGVNLQIFACFVPHQLGADAAFDRANELITILDETIAFNRESISLCNNMTEIDNAIGDGKISAIYSIENGLAIASDLGKLELFYDRSVRCMTLTHVKSHNWCSSSSDSNSAFDGLTQFGKSVVNRMNELGMIIDISHISAGAVKDVLRESRKPVIASHSCVHAICPHDRNLTDEQIMAIADNSGMIGINFCGEFLSESWMKRSKELQERYRDELPKIDAVMNGSFDKSTFDSEYERIKPIVNQIEENLMQNPTVVADVADHIDYVVRLVGDDFVGIGSDYDGIILPPVGLEDCSKLPNLTEELLSRGYAESSVKKILGSNFHRLFKEVTS